MKKFLKITGIGIVIILALLILIPVIFKGKLIELAKTEINKQVNAKIDFGEFDLSIFSYFPNLNLEINDVTVSGIDKFEGDTLLQLKQFSAKVDIISVFGDKIDVLGIHLIEPNIHAHVLPDTSANWDIAKATDTDSTDTKSEDASFNLALKELSIKKANIIYEDELGKMMSNIENLDYNLKGDLSLSTVELEMALLIEKTTLKMGGITYLNKTNIEYNAGINANLDNMKFDLLENEFRMNKLVLSLAGYLQMNKDNSYDMDLSFGTNKNKFKDIISLIPAYYTKDFNDIKTSGEMDLSGFAKGKYSETQLPTFNLKLNIDNASVQYPGLPASVNQIYVNLIVDNKDGVDDHTVVNLDRFDLNLAGNPFSARYVVKTPVSDPYIDGFVKGKLDFNKLKDAIPLDNTSISGLMDMDLKMRGNLSTIEQERYDEFEAKGKIALQDFEYKTSDLDYDVLIESSNFEVSPKHFNLTNFDAKVGKSDFHASGRLDNFLAFYFKDEVLSGTFDLKSNLIDGGELAGESEATEEPKDTTEKAMEVVELPKNIDFKLSTEINKILYNIYTIENFNGKVSLKEGVAKMEPVSMNIIDGLIKMAGTYDSRNVKEPKIDFDLNMTGFEIDKMFSTFNTVEELAPIAKNCKGLINLKFKLNAALDQNMKPIAKTMNGAGQLQSKKVIIGGSESLKKLSGLLMSDKYKQAELKDINGSFAIEDGNITISPFNIKMNNSKATFGGRQGIDQSIDYLLNLNIPRSELGNANKLVENIIAKGGAKTKDIDLGETINADIFITGTIKKPHFSVGHKDMVKNAVEQVKEEVKEKVKEVIDNTKAKAIAEAKKQANALMAEANKQSEKLMAEVNKQADEIRKNGKKAAEQAKAEANKQIDDLMNKAGNNPIAKKAAERTAAKLRNEANTKANQIEAEANKKADQLVNETKLNSDKIKEEAKAKGDKLIAEAEKK